MDRLSVFLKFTLFRHKRLEKQERRSFGARTEFSSFAIDAGGAPPPSLKQRHRPSMEKMVDVKNKRQPRLQDLQKGLIANLTTNSIRKNNWISKKERKVHMKKVRLPIAIGAVALLVLGWFALSPQKAGANLQGGNVVGAGSYLATITVAGTGEFASRSVITIHNDRTGTVIDSGQEGGSPAFSSQQGVWTPDGNSTDLTTLDFSFPPGANIARVDYHINPGPGLGNINGTITLTVFPLNGDPLNGGGTVVGQFNFTGQRM
jgi:hypothetical protein